MPQNRNWNSADNRPQSRGYGQDYTESYRRAERAGSFNDIGNSPEYGSEYGYSTYVNEGLGVNRSLGTGRGTGRISGSFRTEEDRIMGSRQGIGRNLRPLRSGEGRIVRSLREDVDRNLSFGSEEENHSPRTFRGDLSRRVRSLRDEEDFDQRSIRDFENIDVRSRRRGGLNYGSDFPVGNTGSWNEGQDSDLYRRPYRPRYGDRYDIGAMGGSDIWDEERESRDRGVMGRRHERGGMYGSNYGNMQNEDFGYNRTRSNLGNVGRNVGNVGRNVGNVGRNVEGSWDREPQSGWNRSVEGLRERNIEGGRRGELLREGVNRWRDRDINDEFESRNEDWESPRNRRRRNF